MNAKRKTEKEYFQIVNRWRNSGMSRASFCRQEKIHPTTFAGWIKKEGGVSPIGSPKIVPLQIEDSRVAQLDRFEVEYPNGVRLHLATMPSIEELSGIVHLYREPCFR